MERKGPNRVWTGAFKSGPPAAGARSGQPGAQRASAGSAFDVVNDAYRVIDEYLWRGQEMAQRAWMPADEELPPGPGPRGLGRLLRTTEALAAAWLELLQSWSAPGDAASPNAPSVPPGPFSAGVSPRAAAPPASTTDAGVSISVQTSRAVTVHVTLHGEATGSLIVSALQALGAGVPGLHDVSIDAGAGTGPTLRLRVPDDQPGGIYNGMLLDSASGRARGTVTVSVA